MRTEPTFFVMMMVVIFLSLAVHEYVHAKLADEAGDPTPRIHGRVTLNPFNHVDPIGGILIVLSSLAGFGIGWGRPVPMDPRRMRNPRWDHFWAVAAAPISNLLLAVVCSILILGLRQFNVGDQAPFLLLFLLVGVIVNVSLFLFNCIPIGPLDGMWMLGSFLPEPARYQWTRWNLTIGQFVFLALVLIPLPGIGSPISLVLGPLRTTLTGFLLR